MARWLFVSSPDRSSLDVQIAFLLVRRKAKSLGAQIRAGGKQDTLRGCASTNNLPAGGINGGAGSPP
jgi:hypothetical protein